MLPYKRYSQRILGNFCLHNLEAKFRLLLRLCGNAFHFYRKGLPIQNQRPSRKSPSLMPQFRGEIAKMAFDLS